MSIDHYIYVTPEPNAPRGRVYNRVIVADIIEDVNRKGGADCGANTVYLMQGSIEYLYEYADSADARADFERWRLARGFKLRSSIRDESLPEVVSLKSQEKKRSMMMRLT